MSIQSIDLTNLKIIWGSLVITDLFNVESLDEVAPPSAVTYSQKVTASGRYVMESSLAEGKNSFSITVSRTGVMGNKTKNDFETLGDMYKNVVTKPLRVIDSEGKVLIEYKYALLHNNAFMFGPVCGGSHAMVQITWSVSNG